MSLKNTILDFVSANFLTQMTNKPTRHDNALDLILTTDPDLIAELDTHPGMSDRCAVAFKVNVTAKRHKKLDRYVFQYRKGDLDGAKRDIGEFGARFSMKKNIPQKKITSRWNLPWMTPEIKRLCRRKKRAWDAGKCNRHSHA